MQLREVLGYTMLALDPYAARITSEVICGHSSRPHKGLGLCGKCYRRYRTLAKNPNAKSRGSRVYYSTCHPDRRMHRSDGLCGPCSQRVNYYGADFLAMYEVQNGCCKLCGVHCEEEDIVVDHNHTTNRVRGLTCRSCNTLIGLAEHVPAESTLAYLKLNESLEVY